MCCCLEREQGQYADYKSEQPFIGFAGPAGTGHCKLRVGHGRAQWSCCLSPSRSGVGQLAQRLHLGLRPDSGSEFASDHQVDPVRNCSSLLQWLAITYCKTRSPEPDCQWLSNMGRLPACNARCARVGTRRPGREHSIVAGEECNIVILQKTTWWVYTILKCNITKYNNSVI